MFAYSLSSSYVAQILFLPLPSAEHTGCRLSRAVSLPCICIAEVGLGKEEGESIKRGKFLGVLQHMQSQKEDTGHQTYTRSGCNPIPDCMFPL